MKSLDFLAVATSQTADHGPPSNCCEMRPSGRIPKQAFEVWLNRNSKFRDGITKQERNDLMRCVENLPAVEAFHAGLPPHRQRQMNHPTSTLRAWKNAQATHEREAALEQAEARSRDSATADDGTPLNAPVMVSSLGRPVDLHRDAILHRDLGAGLIVTVLRREYPKEKLVAVTRELARVLGLTIVEGSSPPVDGVEWHGGRYQRGGAALMPPFFF